MLKNKKNIGIVLSKDDYYKRPIDKLTIKDLDIEKLILKSRSILYKLLRQNPNPIELDPENTQQIQAQIKSLNTLMQSSAILESEKLLIARQINLLSDLNKINHLEIYSIPQDNNSNLIYCKLNEKINGVTEKISLISIQQVKKQLGHLCQSNALTFKGYCHNRDCYQLNTDAIIKLPKHGSLKEIQHEAIALNLSRLMGLHTTQSTTVSYQNKPALFIPFDNIQLLSEMTTGITFSPLLGFFGSPYTHYSTIKPIGEGIQADQFVDDFGDSLALFYLCSDTDALGGYCQNKGLINGKSLYIFDQVMMEEDKLMIDSRISLQPVQFIMKHTRHGCGRNRTIIEDSSFETKFASIVRLIELEDKIVQYMDEMRLQHSARAKELMNTLKNEPSLQEEQVQAELKIVMLLEEDALQLKSKLQERISQIKKVLPQWSKTISPIDVRQGLILEKLIHIPVLYTDDGRPYKNPWTHRHSNHLISISEYNKEHLQLDFSSKISEAAIQFIKRHCDCKSLTLHCSTSLILKKNELNNIRETCLFPEHQTCLDPKAEYLNIEELEILRQAYIDGESENIIKIIQIYQRALRNEKMLTHQKINWFSETEHSLKQLIEKASNKGFGMHVLKKFYFDHQLQLQKLIHRKDSSQDINKAFSAALQLDKVALFNQVIQAAIAQNKFNTAPVLAFIQFCANCSLSPLNYCSAQKMSNAITRKAQITINDLKKPHPVRFSLLNKSLSNHQFSKRTYSLPFGFTSSESRMNHPYKKEDNNNREFVKEEDTITSISFKL